MGLNPTFWYFGTVTASFARMQRSGVRSECASGMPQHLWNDAGQEPRWGGGGTQRAVEINLYKAISGRAGFPLGQRLRPTRWEPKTGAAELDKTTPKRMSISPERGQSIPIVYID